MCTTGCMYLTKIFGIGLKLFITSLVQSNKTRLLSLSHQAITTERKPYSLVRT